MTTRAGIHFLDIFDHYLSDYVLILVGLLEIIAVAWYYPIEKLVGQVLENTKQKPPRLWSFLLKYVSPVGIAALFLYNLISEFRFGYGDYPGWASFLGWLSVICSFSILGFEFIRFLHEKLKEKIKKKKDTP